MLRVSNRRRKVGLWRPCLSMAMILLLGFFLAVDLPSTKIQWFDVADAFSLDPFRFRSGRKSFRVLGWPHYPSKKKNLAARRKTTTTPWHLLSKEDDLDELPTTPLPEEDLQRELNAIMSDQESNRIVGIYDPEAFDQSQIPLPMFTAVIVLLGSMSLTGYMIWTGITGDGPS